MAANGHALQTIITRNGIADESGGTPFVIVLPFDTAVSSSYDDGRMRDEGMRIVTLSGVKNDLSKYLRMAEEEEIVITRHR